MRIGMICPYSFDVPGGVQAHVTELADVFLDRGHEVSVLAPAGRDTELPDYVVRAGPALAIPYNGSVARLTITSRARDAAEAWSVVVEGGDQAVVEVVAVHTNAPDQPETVTLNLQRDGDDWKVCNPT